MNDQDFTPLAFFSSNGSKMEVPDLIRNKPIQMYLEFINDKSKKLSIIKLSKPISLHPSAVFYPILTLNCTCKVKYLDFKDLNSYFFWFPERYQDHGVLKIFKLNFNFNSLLALIHFKLSGWVCGTFVTIWFPDIRITP